MDASRKIPGSIHVEKLIFSSGDSVQKNGVHINIILAVFYRLPFKIYRMPIFYDKRNAFGV